jgi:hypothetical protein
MTGMHSGSRRTHDAQRLFPTIDRYLVLFVVLELVAFPFVPFLPFGVAAASLATPVRTSRWRSTVLWTLAALLGLIMAAPFILGLFDIHLVTESPVHTIAP